MITLKFVSRFLKLVQVYEQYKSIQPVVSAQTNYKLGLCGGIRVLVDTNTIARFLAIGASNQLENDKIKFQPFEKMGGEGFFSIYKPPQIFFFHLNLLNHHSMLPKIQDVDSTQHHTQKILHNHHHQQNIHQNIIFKGVGITQIKQHHL